MRKFLKALLSSLAKTVQFVFEGGRWVARVLTGVQPIQPEISAAEEAAEAELAAHQALLQDPVDALDAMAFEPEPDAETTAARSRSRWPMAVLVKEHLWARDAKWSGKKPSIAHLPSNVQGWLKSLSAQDSWEVRTHTHLSDLEAHLAGRRQLNHLPRLATTLELIVAAEEAARERQAVADALQEILEAGRRAA